MSFTMLNGIVVLSLIKAIKYTVLYLLSFCPIYLFSFLKSKVVIWWFTS